MAAIAFFTPAMAQSSASGSGGEPTQTDQQIAEGIVMGREAYAQRALRRRCGSRAPDGSIVVCGQNDEEFRVKSTAELDPNSKEALDDGRLHPPDVAGRGIFKGKPTIGGLCLIPPCPKGSYLIDLSQIPPPPPGSDADKVAKGEMRDR